MGTMHHLGIRFRKCRPHHSIPSAAGHRQGYCSVHQRNSSLPVSRPCGFRPDTGISSNHVADSRHFPRHRGHRIRTGGLGSAFLELRNPGDDRYFLAYLSRKEAALGQISLRGQVSHCGRFARHVVRPKRLTIMLKR